MMRTLLTALFFVAVIVNATAQNSKTLTAAQQLFGFKKYDQALPKFLEAYIPGSKMPWFSTK